MDCPHCGSDDDCQQEYYCEACEEYFVDDCEDGCDE